MEKETEAQKCLPTCSRSSGQARVQVSSLPALFLIYPTTSQDGTEWKLIDGLSLLFISDHICWALVVFPHIILFNFPIMKQVLFLKETFTDQLSPERQLLLLKPHSIFPYKAHLIYIMDSPLF